MPETLDGYISRDRTLEALSARLGIVSLEELAAWVSLGPEMGGLAAYIGVKELPEPHRFDFSVQHSYLNATSHWWFRQEDIDAFRPAERFITGRELIERWQNPNYPDLVVNDICARIAEGELIDMHPATGFTRWSTLDDEYLPDGETALFALSDVIAVEREYGIKPSSAREPFSGTSGGKGRPPSDKSLRHLTETGQLQTDAVAAAQRAHNRKRDDVTRGRVARELLMTTYSLERGFKLSHDTLTRALKQEWWNNKLR